MTVALYIFIVWGRFFGCITGPEWPPPPNVLARCCACHDENGDGHVDLADFALWSNQISELGLVP